LNGQTIYYTLAVTVAVIAVLLHILEMRKNNRLNLFNKRIEVYTAVSEMVKSYAAFRNVRDSVGKLGKDPLLNADFYLRNLTSNAFLHTIAPDHELSKGVQSYDSFSQKMTKVSLLTVKLRLLFRSKRTAVLNNFVRSYIDALWALKRCEMFSARETGALEIEGVNTAQEVFAHSDLQRKLAEDMTTLDDSYKELTEKDVMKPLEEQIKP
jgi:hypothetical protein